MYIMESLPYTQRKRAQSFSSSLLDAIYSSIDESKSTTIGNKKETSHRHSHSSQFMYSSSSATSTSSAFSSSDAGTVTHINGRRSPIRPMRHVPEDSQHQKPNNKREGGGGGRTGFARTKLRALKIYGELNQKVRHPISPGGRIASFLGSIFNSGNVKKAKLCSVGAAEDVTSSGRGRSKSPCFSNSSTASSSASFPRRSCMSKTSSSSSKGNKAKRSVRFYPVSVILGAEDESDPSLLPLPSVGKVNATSSSIKEPKKKKKKNCVDEVEASARGFMSGYNRNSGRGGNTSKFGYGDFYRDDDDDDDALSYSSSDLFELDLIIGGAGTRYQEELPVYETTNLETNKAIANGLC